MGEQEIHKRVGRGFQVGGWRPTVWLVLCRIHHPEFHNTSYTVSHDRQLWKFLSNLHKDDLVVKDVTEFLRSRTWLTQTRRSGVFDDLKVIVKRQCYHRHPHFNHTRFVRIGYHIESTLRSVAVDADAIRPARKYMMMLVLHKLALPLTKEPLSKFCLFDALSGQTVSKLLKQQFYYKPKAVSALVTSAEENQKGKTKRRRKTEAKPASDQPAPSPSDAPVKVEEQKLQYLRFHTIISNIIDEGFWQLLTQNVDVDACDECKAKTTELLTLAFLIGVGAGPINLGTTEEPVMVNDIPTFRDHAHARLTEFSDGYMVVSLAHF